MAYKDVDALRQRLISEGMKPGTPLNMPKYSLWVQDNDGWKLYSGRDSNEFNKHTFLNQTGYKNALITNNGEDPESTLKSMRDYDLFNAIHYSPWQRGRPNYLEGEEKSIWDELSKQFDLPKYEPHKYGFRVNDKDKKVYLGTNGVQDGRGFGGWEVKPQDLGLLKRRN